MIFVDGPGSLFRLRISSCRIWGWSSGRKKVKIRVSLLARANPRYLTLLYQPAESLLFARAFHVVLLCLVQQSVHRYGVVCLRLLYVQYDFARLLLGKGRGVSQRPVAFRRELDNQLVGRLLETAQGLDHAHCRADVALGTAYGEDDVHGTTESRRAPARLSDFSA